MTTTIIIYSLIGIILAGILSNIIIQERKDQGLKVERFDHLLVFIIIFVPWPIWIGYMIYRDYIKGKLW